MPIAGSHRWRRFGTVAEQIAKVVYDRRRLLGIREEVAVAYQMELAELRAVYDERLAYLDAAACKAPLRHRGHARFCGSWSDDKVDLLDLWQFGESMGGTQC